MRLWPSLSLALSLLVAPPRAGAEPAAGTPVPAATLGDITARVEALTRIDALDDSVKRPLALARHALERARAARAERAYERAERAEQLAFAAIELAEARLRLERERALGQATARRRQEAERSLARARAEASPPP